MIVFSWLCRLLLDVLIGCVIHSFQNVSFFFIIVLALSL